MLPSRLPTKRKARQPQRPRHFASQEPVTKTVHTGFPSGWETELTTHLRTVEDLVRRDSSLPTKHRPIGSYLRNISSRFPVITPSSSIATIRNVPSGFRRCRSWRSCKPVRRILSPIRWPIFSTSR